MYQIKFGTDGWRALMDGKAFTESNVRRLSQAIACHLKDTNSNSEITVAVGYDYRKNSQAYANEVTRVLHANGIKVMLSNVAVPTPAVSRAVLNHSLPMGIAVTASHNPGDYNGIKIKDALGSSADMSITKDIESRVDGVEIQISNQDVVAESLCDLMTPYLNSIKEYLDLKSFQNKSIKVLIDSMHGVGAKIIENILSGTTVSVDTIRSNQRDDFGGGAPEPILKNLSEAEELMKNEKYDVAFATDGDSDRIGSLHPGGGFVSPGKLLTLIMLHLVEDLHVKGSVVTTVSNTALIYEAANHLGLTVHETPVGFKHIVDIMKKETVLVAGEESGGLAFKDYMNERDGVLSALLIIQMMQMRNKTFNELLQEMESRFGVFKYNRIDVEYPEEYKNACLDHLRGLEQNTICGLEVKDISDKDGVKLYFTDGSWLLFRMSGTEPLLRIYSESKVDNLPEQLTEWGRDEAFRITR